MTISGSVGYILDYSQDFINMLFITFAYSVSKADQKGGSKQAGNPGDYSELSAILLSSIIQNYFFLSLVRGANNGLLSLIAHRHGRDQNYLNYLYYRNGQMLALLLMKVVILILMPIAFVSVRSSFSEPFAGQVQRYILFGLINMYLKALIDLQRTFLI